MKGEEEGNYKERANRGGERPGKQRNKGKEVGSVLKSREEETFYQL